MNYLDMHFLDRMKSLLGDEYDDFIKSLSEKQQKSIFVNTNKISVDSFFFRAVVKK